MSQLTTSFADSTYSSSSKPSVATLKADISAIETAHNETDTHSVRDDGTVAFSANQSMGGFKLTSLAAPTAATDAASIGAAWPIGSVFTSVVSTNPATLLGFGTWSAIAAGKMLIGLDSGDATMDTAEETGGAKTYDLSHTHTGPSHTHDMANHTHTYSGTTSSSSSYSSADGTGDVYSQDEHTHTYSGTSAGPNTNTTGAAGTGATSSSGSATQSVMNPFFVVYFWKRTA